MIGSVFDLETGRRLVWYVRGRKPAKGTHDGRYYPKWAHLDGVGELPFCLSVFQFGIPHTETDVRSGQMLKVVCSKRQGR